MFLSQKVQKLGNDFLLASKRCLVNQAENNDFRLDIGFMRREQEKIQCSQKLKKRILHQILRSIERKKVFCTYNSPIHQY